MKAVKIKKYEYRLGGIMTYWKTEFDNIEHNGKIYTNTTRIEKSIDLDEDFKKEKKEMNWYCEEYDELASYGIIVKIWTLSNISNIDIFSHPLEYVFYFNDNNENEITGIHYGKINYETYKEHGFDCINNRKVILPVKHYGFNNTVNIYLTLEYFLNIDFKIHNIYTQYFIKHCFDEILPTKYFNDSLTDTDKIRFLTNVLTSKINYKRRNRLCYQ